jgi:hypothetical protein
MAWTLQLAQAGARLRSEDDRQRQSCFGRSSEAKRVVALKNERELLAEVGLERPEFHSSPEPIRREDRSSLPQPDWLQAQSQTVGQDLGRVEKRDAISVRRVRTQERNENLFVPGICLEDEGGSG